MTREDVILAYRLIKRDHPDLRKKYGQAVLYGLKDKLGDLHEAQAAILLAVGDGEVAQAMCAVIQEPVTLEYKRRQLAAKLRAEAQEATGA